MILPETIFVELYKIIQDFEEHFKLLLALLVILKREMDFGEVEELSYEKGAELHILEIGKITHS